MNRKKSLAGYGALLVLVFLSGCSTVQVWERGNLAKPHMEIDPHDLQSGFRGHSYGSREAATAGNAGQGGGCGCY